MDPALVVPPVNTAPTGVSVPGPSGETGTVQKNYTYVSFSLKRPYAVKDHVQTTRKQTSFPWRTSHRVSFPTSCHTVCKKETYNVASDTRL